MSYIEFNYGSADLTEQNMKKIETLVKARKAKPALKLDIVGGVDMELDREGLIQEQFQSKLKVQKMRELIRKGDKVASVVEPKTLQPEAKKDVKKSRVDFTLK